MADPDGAERDDQFRRAARDVYLDRSFGGMWFGKLRLDPWPSSPGFDRGPPGESGVPAPVEVSEKARLFTGALRRSIEIRDRECTHPYCDIEADKCQADHIIPYAAGGLTTQENGRLLCGFHNRQRNGLPPPGD
jgi:HNH endonuclease